MSAIDDAFDDLAEQVAEQLSLGLTVTIRKVESGSLDVGALSRNKVKTPIVGVRAVRSAGRPGFSNVSGAGGGAGGSAASEEVEFLVSAADVEAAAGEPFVPDEGDLVIDAQTGRDVHYIIASVRREVGEKMLALVCRQMRLKQ